MAVNQSNAPTIALLGGGYTLQRVGSMLAPGSFVITSRDADTCAAWSRNGWLSHRVALDDPRSIESLFRAFPTLEVLVDSVPPFRDGEPSRGVRAVVDAIRDSKVRRIIYLSTTGVFGVRDGSEVDESTPPSPWNPQGAARLACEGVYREFVRQHPGVSFTALRLPAIYGEDRGVAFSLREGTYALVDGGVFWTNRIHVHDLARVIVSCSTFTGTLPDVLCVADDHPTKAIDIASYICEREKLPMPRSISAEEVERRGAYTMLSNQRVRNQHMKTLLGISLRYPSFREGIYGEGADKP
jgi:dTDP-4-dehydrorhamnose reductase